MLLINDLVLFSNHHLMIENKKIIQFKMMK